MALRSYTRALRVLQEAVSDADACEDADLIAAVQMLGLREIVDMSPTGAYSSHVAGSARLVRRRTPAGFTTEYEKLLFLAHMGPAFTEAMYNSEPCYLEEPAWLRLYESFVDHDSMWLSDRSELVIRIRLQMLVLNGLLIDVGKVVDPNSTPDAMLYLRTELKTRRAHQILQDALKDYKTHIYKTSTFHPPISEINMRREIFGTAIECLVLYKRMLATMCEAERLQLEAETRVLLDVLVKLGTQQPESKYSWIYTTQERGVAQVIQLTMLDWEKDLGGLSEREKRVEAWKRWVRLTHYLHASDAKRS